MVAREDALYGIVGLEWTKVSAAEISSMIRNNLLGKLCIFKFLIYLERLSASQQRFFIWVLGLSVSVCSCQK